MTRDGISADVIEAELEKILASRAFAKALRATRFLRFVVQKQLDGKGSEIKEYVVGVEVFSKSADFDPRTDTIVRAEAKRLRERLDQYYAFEGKEDAVRILVPKGSYSPKFEHNGPAPHDETARVIRPRARLYLAPVLLALSGVGISGGLLWRFSSYRGSDAELVPRPLTSYPGHVASPSFSPDGNQVAFSWRPSPASHSSIYAKLIGVNEPLRLTNEPADDYGPAWSPDGQAVAFLRPLADGKDGLFLVPSIGGRPRKVTEIFPTGLSDCHAWQPAWHPSGRWIVVFDRDSAEGSFRLFAVSPTTGERRALTSPPLKSVGDLYPSFAPDGRTLAFSRSTSPNVSELYALAVDENLRAAKGPRRITSEHFYTGQSAWTLDGGAIVFSGGDFHNPSLWKVRVDRHSAKATRLAFAPEGVESPVISRHGSLAFARVNIDTDIWRVDLTGASHSVTKLISSTRLDHTPRFSPDGKRIVFASNRSGSHEIFVSNSDGSNAVQLTSFGGFNYRADPHWSPDQRWIYFNYVRDDGFECWIIGSDGGAATRATQSSEACPSAWSPDGAWSYFDRDGQVWKMPSNGGPAGQITHHGGTAPLPSADGKWLYYRKTDDEITSLWKVPVNGGEEARVIESVVNDNVSATPRGIYFGSDPAEVHVDFLNFGTGKIEPIARMPQMPVYGFDVSRDGKCLIYAAFESVVLHDLMLVEKFQ